MAMLRRVYYMLIAAPQSLFPHGIDVLRKTDFYAVGIRRNAFVVAAPGVAE